MAQQAILASVARRRHAARLGFGATAAARAATRLRRRPSLTEALASNEDKLLGLFEWWEEEHGVQEIHVADFRRSIRVLGIRSSRAEFERFVSSCDLNGSGTIDLDELKQLLETEKQRRRAAEQKLREEARQQRRHHRWPRAVWDQLNSRAGQTLLYTLLVVIFQMIGESLRLKEELWLVQSYHESFFESRYDAQLNAFANIRREADVWEWGNRVLLPGLFSDSDVGCGPNIGAAGHFRSSQPEATTAGEAGAAFKGGCNDDTWPDGDGAMSRVGASAFTVPELVDRMNQMDWTDGILLKQARSRAVPSLAACGTAAIGGLCYPEPLVGPTHADGEGREGYGRNWTHPGSPLSRPFKWQTASTLGVNPAGEPSNHFSSLAALPPDGFASVILPFFSEVLLPDERGLASQVTDFRLHRASRREPRRVPRYFCVRLSWDGEFVHQLCDPNDAEGRTTGVVRAAVEEFWNDLKRAHWIDAATRSVTLTMVVASNSVGASMRYRLNFEFPTSGHVHASFDAIPMVTKQGALQSTSRLLWLALVLIVVFCVFELVELSGLEDGVFELSDITDYVTNVRMRKQGGSPERIEF